MATIAQRRRAQALAGKERRKKVLAIGGACLLVIALVIQGPRMLELFSSDSVAVVAAPPPPVAPPPPPARELPLPAGPAVDPFRKRPLVGGDPAPANVSNPDGVRDPFMPAVTSVELATERIIVGTPAPGRSPTVGSIVILASIRTAAGRAVAEQIARTARVDGLGRASVLDSSSSRPLRAGYYVAYLGPFRSGSAARAARERARALGYRTAYVRELVRYG